MCRSRGEKKRLVIDCDKMFTSVQCSTFLCCRVRERRVVDVSQTILWSVSRSYATFAITSNSFHSRPFGLAFPIPCVSECRLVVLCNLLMNDYRTFASMCVFAYILIDRRTVECVRRVMKKSTLGRLCWFYVYMRRHLLPSFRLFLVSSTLHFSLFFFSVHLKVFNSQLDFFPFVKLNISFVRTKLYFVLRFCVDNFSLSNIISTEVCEVSQCEFVFRVI